MSEPAPSAPGLAVLPDGSYPVMLTAFDAELKIDYPAMDELIEWYVAAGSAGLFTNSRSSEFEFLDPTERLELARYVVERAAGRVKVVSTGSLGKSPAADAAFIQEMAQTGVDAVVIITNHLAPETATEAAVSANLDLLISMTDDIDLGFYECPTPWKRLLSPAVYQQAAVSQRFVFHKDTSHHQPTMATRVALGEGTRMRLFNAQTSSIIEGIRLGAAGHSGIAANLHPELIAWLCANASTDHPRLEEVQDFVTIAEAVIGAGYPTSAKQYLRHAHRIAIGTDSRMSPTAERDDHGLRPLHSLARRRPSISA